MGDLSFDPIVGEDVRVLGRQGLYKVVRVYRKPSRVLRAKNDVGHPSPALELMFVDLKSEVNNEVLTDVPANSEKLKFDETHPVRCAIEWLKTNPNDRKYPDFIVDYEISTRDDHAGNPSIFVRFLVDPNYFYENGRASQEKIAQLNEFTYGVQQVLLGLDLNRWTYVETGEARRALDVAS
ncbi:MAG: hypothetical protein ACP5E2_06365 [Terracidiphilus sp.]